MTHPDFDWLSALFTYDPATGFLHRRHSARGHWAGAVAGSKTKYGYVALLVDKRYLFAHRVAFLLMTGDWPADFVDHVNRVRDDNRWENLRPAVPFQNQANRASGRDGLKGVTRLPHGRFQAQIKRDGRSHYLGSFDTEAEAHAAYAAKAVELFGEFARAA